MALKKWRKTHEMATSDMKMDPFILQRWQEKSQIDRDLATSSICETTAFEIQTMDIPTPSKAS